MKAQSIHGIVGTVFGVVVLALWVSSVSKPWGQSNENDQIVVTMWLSRVEFRFSVGNYSREYDSSWVSYKGDICLDEGNDAQNCKNARNNENITITAFFFTAFSVFLVLGFVVTNWMEKSQIIVVFALQVMSFLMYLIGFLVYSIGISSKFYAGGVEIQADLALGWWLSFFNLIWQFWFGTYILLLKDHLKFANS